MAWMQIERAKRVTYEQWHESICKHLDPTIMIVDITSEIRPLRERNETISQVFLNGKSTNWFFEMKYDLNFGKGVFLQQKRKGFDGIPTPEYHVSGVNQSIYRCLYQAMAKAQMRVTDSYEFLI